MGLAKLFSRNSSSLELKEELIQSMATAMQSSLHKIDPSLSISSRSEIVKLLKNPVRNHSLERAINNSMFTYKNICDRNRNVLGVRNAIVNTPEYSDAQIATGKLISHGMDYMNIFKSYDALEEARTLANENRLTKLDIKEGRSVSDKQMKLDAHVKELETSIYTTAAKYVQTKESLTDDPSSIYTKSLDVVLTSLKEHILNEYVSAAGKVSVVTALEKLSHSGTDAVKPGAMASFILNDKLNMYSNGVRKYIDGINVKSHIQENGLSAS